MNAAEQELLENIRRTAQRGKAEIERSYLKHGPLDCFLHILNLVEQIQNNENRSQPPADSGRSSQA